MHYGGRQSEVAWLQAMMAAVRQFGEPTFLLLLDDYGLCGSPQVDRIMEAVSLVTCNPPIGMFALCWYPAGHRHSLTPGIVRLERTPVLLQAAIWRADWFLALGESVEPQMLAVGVRGGRDASGEAHSSVHLCVRYTDAVSRWQLTR